MVIDWQMASYKKILQITEQIEVLLVSGELDSLQTLLQEREEAFLNLKEKPQQEVAEVIEKILKSEKRCMALALEKKKELRQDLKVTQNKKRLQQAYGQHMA